MFPTQNHFLNVDEKNHSGDDVNDDEEGAEKDFKPLLCFQRAEHDQLWTARLFQTY
jgi:hypothetical protein